jgi:hypothetical protein
MTEKVILLFRNNLKCDIQLGMLPNSNKFIIKHKNGDILSVGDTIEDTVLKLIESFVLTPQYRQDYIENEQNQETTR